MVPIVVENSSRAFELLRAGDADRLRQLMERDDQVAEARDGNGISLLMLCMYQQWREVAEFAGQKKKSLDIFEAASLGKIDQLKKLIREGIDVNALSIDGFTALHFACYFSQPEAALVLIESGAAVDAVSANPMKLTPLHSAASARNLEAARVLLEHGAPVNARQHGGWVAIHAAAGNGDRALVELLLKHRADARVMNDEGMTPAMVARGKGQEELAELLARASLR
jgi:uncharacterized protein